MDWLVVTGEPRAKFHGTGTVNGTYTCQFQVDAWDNSFSNSKADAFGTKIYSCDGGADSNANRYSIDPTPLTGGSIIIHKQSRTPRIRTILLWSVAGLAMDWEPFNIAVPLAI